MAVINPSFVFSLEQNMRVLQEAAAESKRLLSNLWWTKVARVVPSKAGREVLNWVLNTAVLENTGVDPTPNYRDMQIMNTAYVPQYITAALKLQRAQFEDLDGGGVDIASDWATQMGAQAVYFPQKTTAATILTGESGICYDGLAYFANNHPINPKDSSKGTFANLFTGAVASTPATDPNDAFYPGALNVATATYETIFAGLQNIFSYIAAQKMQNGIDPRMLRPAALLCPSALYPKMNAVLSSQFIAATAAGGTASAGGAMSIEGQMQKLGYGEVIHAPEFDSDPTSFYLAVEQMTTSQLGSIVYVDREPVGIRYYTGQDGANVTLGRTDELEWIARGRAVGGFGHPYLLYKIKAS